MYSFIEDSKDFLDLALPFFRISLSFFSLYVSDVTLLYRQSHRFEQQECMQCLQEGQHTQQIAQQTILSTRVPAVRRLAFPIDMLPTLSNIMSSIQG